MRASVPDFQPVLVLLDLRLPDRDLVLDDFREVLLQCHLDPTLIEACSFDDLIEAA